MRKVQIYSDILLRQYVFFYVYLYIKIYLFRVGWVAASVIVGKSSGQNAGAKKYPPIYRRVPRGASGAPFGPDLSGQDVRPARTPLFADRMSGR